MIALAGNSCTINWEFGNCATMNSPTDFATMPIRAKIEIRSVASTETTALYGYGGGTGIATNTGLWSNTATSGSITSDNLIESVYRYDNGTAATINTINTYRVILGTGDDIGFGWSAFPSETPKEKLKKLLAERAVPHIITHAKPLGMTKDEREIRARETLLRVLGVPKFQDFLRKGFISIRAKSGLIYQIFPGHDFTKVYNCGKLVERLCVVMNGGFPPTDSLIMRYLMILNNEDQFRGLAVKHGVPNQDILKIRQPDSRSLVEIFREFKKAAA